eukprot:m.54895 g.54895  ORF g.54895 m.54895 type:complete len:447 (-) comp13274_c1_seq3:130-1470(-)
MKKLIVFLQGNSLRLRGMLLAFWFLVFGFLLGLVRGELLDAAHHAGHRGHACGALVALVGDLDVLVANLQAVHGLDGVGAGLRVVVGDKAKALALAGLRVDKDAGADDVAKGQEGGGQGVVVKLLGQVVDEEVGTLGALALGGLGRVRAAGVLAIALLRKAAGVELLHASLRLRHVQAKALAHAALVAVVALALAEAAQAQELLLLEHEGALLDGVEAVEERVAEALAKAGHAGHLLGGLVLVRVGVAHDEGRAAAVKGLGVVQGGNGLLGDLARLHGGKAAALAHAVRVAQDGDLVGVAKGRQQRAHVLLVEGARDLADEELDRAVVRVGRLDHHGRAAAVKGRAVVQRRNGLLRLLVRGQRHECAALADTAGAAEDGDLLDGAEGREHALNLLLGQGAGHLADEELDGRAGRGSGSGSARAVVHVVAVHFCDDDDNDEIGGEKT